MRSGLSRVLVGATLWLSACAPTSGSGGPATPAPVPTRPAVTASAAATPSQAVPSTTPGPAFSASPEAQQAIDAAVRDAATQLNVSAADVHVDRVEARQWPDTSLGCPRQGVMYAQIVTPGFLVVVSGGGKQLEYHTDARGRVVLCAER
jgi:hypothetical protein